MKKNAKGFTLIELLAVITIMGILMIVAIPAVTRTIENSRKDTFVNTVQNYVGGAKTMWASDNLQCGDFVSSAVQTGYYYIAVNSASTSVPQLLESGGKSSWGSRDIMGTILVKVYDVKQPGKDGTSGTDDDVVTRKVEYYPTMVDDIHGVNITTAGQLTFDKKIVSEKLKRGNLLMSGAKYTLVATAPTTGSNLADYTINAPTYTYDFDGDGTDETGSAIECVEV